MSADPNTPDEQPTSGPTGGSLWDVPEPSAPLPPLPPPDPTQTIPAQPVFAPPGQSPQPAPVAPAPQAQPQGQPVFVPPGAAQPGAPQFVNPTWQQPAQGRARFVKPTGPPPGTDLDRPWRWFVGPTAVVVAFLGVIALVIVVLIARSAIDPHGMSGTEFSDKYEHWFSIAQEVLWISIALLMPFLFVSYLRPQQLGLRRPPNIWIAIATFVGAFVVFFILSALYTLVAGLNDDSNQLLTQDNGFGVSLSQDIAFAVVYTVAAPVAEELLFRGLLFRTLRDGFMSKFPKGGPWIAALVSGVIFGAIHVGGGQNDYLPVLMIFGVLLALAYHFSGSLYVTILLHAVNNAIATGGNVHPTHNGVYWLIGFGPILALVLAFLVAQFVKLVFRSEPKNSAHPPSAQTAIV